MTWPTAGADRPPPWLIGCVLGFGAFVIGMIVLLILSDKDPGSLMAFLGDITGALFALIAGGSAWKASAAAKRAEDEVQQLRTGGQRRG